MIFYHELIAYLISKVLLLSHFGLKVSKCTHKTQKFSLCLIFIQKWTGRLKNWRNLAYEHHMTYMKGYKWKTIKRIRKGKNKNNTKTTIFFHPLLPSPSGDEDHDISVNINDNVHHVSVGNFSREIR